MLMASALLVTGGLVLLRQDDTSVDRFVDYAGVAFFGFCGLIALAQLMPGCSFLRLTPEGIVVCMLWRETTYRWSDIERFGVVEYVILHARVGGRQRMIGLDFAPSHARRVRARIFEGIEQEPGGYDSVLPDNYGWDCAELAAHLNAWRARFVPQSGTAGSAR